MAFIEFDGRNTDDMNWFHNSRILNSSWTDMQKAGTFNVFSINKLVLSNLFTLFLFAFQYRLKCSPKLCIFWNDYVIITFLWLCFRENQYGRNFFINRSYGGCGADTGWFVVNDVSGSKPCDWEKVINETYPQFLYGKNGKVTKWGAKGKLHIIVIGVNNV